MLESAVIKPGIGYFDGDAVMPDIMRNDNGRQRVADIGIAPNERAGIAMAVARIDRYAALRIDLERIEDGKRKRRNPLRAISPKRIGSNNAVIIREPDHIDSRIPDIRIEICRRIVEMNIVDIHRNRNRTCFRIGRNQDIRTEGIGIDTLRSANDWARVPGKIIRSQAERALLQSIYCRYDKRIDRLTGSFCAPRRNIRTGKSTVIETDDKDRIDMPIPRSVI